MNLPRFEYLKPRDLGEAVGMLHDLGEDCKILAGGTDILVRMKHRLLTPKYLMSLKSLNGLCNIRNENGFVCIGAGTSLSEITKSQAFKKRHPALFQAINSVGAATIQHHRGTISGNLSQDTRCLHYNQSAFWRSTKPACHKAGGKTCYARADSDRCHGTFQSDCAPALIALDAHVVLNRKNGSRTLPLVDFYSSNGEAPLSLEPDEILTEIRIPEPQEGNGSSYKRLSYRSAIDYPIASVGAFVNVVDAVINDARIVVGAVSRAPLFLTQVSKQLSGVPISDKTALQKAADNTMDLASAFAVDNVGSSLEYRIQMISVLARRALEAAIVTCTDSDLS